MKANRAIKDDRAEVGVGTLIVFIAMVLVAAVAAAVLINTTGTLQERAQSTGKEATSEVSSNLKVLNVYGLRDTTTPDNIIEIKLATTLSAGSIPMDLQKLIVRYSDGTNTPTNFVWEAYDGSPAAGTVQADWIRGDSAGTDGDSVMETGDLVELHFVLGASLAERVSAEVTVVPEAGSPVRVDFTTPASFGDDEIITLR